MCDLWPGHHAHTGDRSTCACDRCLQLRDTPISERLRVRILPGRSPYGQRLWSAEVYDPAGRPNMRVLIWHSWCPSWDQARRRGLTTLGEYRSGLRPVL
ncbi:hypothetical protein GCM10022254_09590 [Actinomadura meridiana]|uniref:Uncharacterized protein n=1 Tax=Actinomadura meridiana TaxID=559626 RepID=A0ABP8BTW6_9ACTN